MQIWIWGDDLSNKQMFHKNVPVENYKINLKNIWIQFHFYYTLPVRFCGLFSLSIFSPSINNIFLWIISLLLSIHLIVFFDNKKIFFCCFCSVTNSCPTLCVPMDRSTPDFPVLHISQSLLNSYPLSWGYHPTISCSVTPFSSYPFFPSIWVFS